MKIIIAGAGEVGTHLAKVLSRERQDIVSEPLCTSGLLPLSPINIL